MGNYNFNIIRTIVIFKVIALVLRSLIFMSDKGSLIATNPSRFARRNISAIIDASEIFLETPKNPVLQKLTWSQYKHHNTAKILVAITPNSFITFVSKAYPGSISDKKITNLSKFLEIPPMYSVVMADKGFNIDEECTNHFLYINKPPGKRGAYQMLLDDIQKTKEVANRRILVEQVIRQKELSTICSELLTGMTTSRWVRLL